jgi:pyrophosphatase PpaX
VETPYSTILFDLDGTLLDSIELIVGGYQHTTAVHLGQPIERAAIIPDIGRALPEVMEELAPGRSAELLPTYRRFVIEQHDRLARLYPDVLVVLSELRRRHYRLGIVTSKARPVAALAFDGLGLAPLLDLTICLEETSRHKPAPDPLLEAAQRLACRPADCLYVGDSTHDLLAARAAGMPVAAALWGPYPYQALAALQPAYLLEALPALLPHCPPRPTVPRPSAAG